MGENGALKNADGTPVSDHNNYRYDDRKDTNSLNQEERQLKERLKQIDEQKKAKPDTGKVTTKLEKDNEADGEAASSGKTFSLLSLESFFN